MAIRSRSSNDHLSRDVILSKITEYDIFRYYCSPFKELNSKFCSDLRKDHTPTVSIIKWNSKLLYKDFGYAEHTFDCFSYVQHKYNIQFFDCLRIIDNDFNKYNNIYPGSTNDLFPGTPKEKKIRKSPLI